MQVTCNGDKLHNSYCDGIDCNLCVCKKLVFLWCKFLFLAMWADFLVSGTNCKMVLTYWRKMSRVILCYYRYNFRLKNI